VLDHWPHWQLQVVLHPPGECRDSYVDGSQTNTIIECLLDCKDNSKCNDWTFDPNSKFCLQFERCNSYSDEECQDCICGGKECDAVECYTRGECEEVILI
jgi:hypothetical protein